MIMPFSYSLYFKKMRLRSNKTIHLKKQPVICMNYIELIIKFLFPIKIEQINLILKYFYRDYAFWLPHNKNLKSNY